MSLLRASPLGVPLTALVIFLARGIHCLPRRAYLYPITTTADAFNSRFNRDAGKLTRLKSLRLHTGLIVADVGEVYVLLQLPRHRCVRSGLLRWQLQPIITLSIVPHDLLHLVHVLLPLSLIVVLVLALASSPQLHASLLGCAYALLQTWCVDVRV